MRIIKAGYEFVTPITPVTGIAILKRIEEVGRTCYKSEDKITEDSAPQFVKKIIENGHEAMIEHCSFSVKFICDRGVSHEIVRHRIAAYAQESTRYCNYSKDKFGNEITFILPCWFSEETRETLLYFDSISFAMLDNTREINEISCAEREWLSVMIFSEMAYKQTLKQGWTAQEARSVLPNSLKTEIVVTMNLREWRHFFKLRTAKTAHPQMQEITRPLLADLKALIPIVFDDIDWE